MIDRRQPKRQRIRDLLACLPPDAGVMPATDLDAGEKVVEIVQDGRLMVGTSWVTPTDYQDQEVERHELPSLKGVTPVEWPELEN